MQSLSEALRDSLIEVRHAAGFDSIRAFAREIDQGQGHIQMWRFERGDVIWPEDPDQRVGEYARVAGVDPLDIWRDVARRWIDSLGDDHGVTVADQIIPRP